MLRLNRGGLAKLGLAIIPSAALASERSALRQPQPPTPQTFPSPLRPAFKPPSASATLQAATSAATSAQPSPASSPAPTRQPSPAPSAARRPIRAEPPSAITAAAITGTGLGVIPATAWEMTCSGGTTGSPTNPGTPGTLANRPHSRPRQSPANRGAAKSSPTIASSSRSCSTRARFRPTPTPRRTSRRRQPRTKCSAGLQARSRSH